MSWEQARALVARGFDVGSHGQTHAILTTLDDEQLALELVLLEAASRVENRK